MAAIAPAVATLAVAGVKAGSIAAISATTFAIAGAQLALGFISSALAPKAPSADTRSAGETRQVRQPIVQREVVYGEVRKSGSVVELEVTDENKYQHVIIAIADHEIESIDEIFLNEVSIPLDSIDSNGNVTDGFYADHVRIKMYTGNQTVADPDAVAEIPSWTSNHIGYGIAYVYLRYEWDRDIFASGTPNFSAFIRGKKLVEYRNGNFSEEILTEAGENLTTETGEFLITESVKDDTQRIYSANVPLVIADYLTTSKEKLNGIGADGIAISDDNVTAQSNIADEMVTSLNVQDDVLSADSDIITLRGVNDVLQYQRGDRVSFSGPNLPTGITAGVNYYVIPYQRKDNPRIKIATSLQNAMLDIAVSITGTGTGFVFKNAEPRYHGGGVYNTGVAPDKIISDMSASMAGDIVYSGGKYDLQAGAYNAPVYYFDESDLAGAITVNTKIGKQERINRVQGQYSNPINIDNLSDYPAVTNSTYVEQDKGEILNRTLDLNFTKRSANAERIGKVLLERSRQEIKFNADFKLTAFQLRAGDTFYFSFAQYGWTNKIFEVQKWELSVENGKPVISMSCREIASEVFDWNNGEETSVDPAPNTTLPNSFTVSVVTGVSLDSIKVATQAGDNTYKINMSWDQHPDQLVFSGGRFDVEFKKASDAGWSDAGLVSGSSTERDLFQAELDTLYDVRIRAVNSIGVTSAYTLVEDFSVGSSFVTDTEDWENETLARDGDDWENDTLTSEDWEA